MENQEELGLGIGTKEPETLPPAVVKIGEIEIEEVQFEKKLQKKVVCNCIHPNKEEAIKIRKVKFAKGDKLVVTGLWLSLDEDKQISKVSALASLMSKLAVATLGELKGKEIATETDEKGYLIFKAY